MQKVVACFLAFAAFLASCGIATVKTGLGPSETPGFDVPPQPTPLPTTPPTETPLPLSAFTDFPALVYLQTLERDSGYPKEVFLSSSDGSSIPIFQTLPESANLYDSDIVKTTGTILFSSQIRDNTIQRRVIEESIWIIHRGEEPKKIALHGPGASIESPRISLDGSRIAYSLYDFAQGIYQLWVVNSDGSDHRLIANNTQQFISEPGPFRLAPIAWSKDNSKIYLTTNTDSEATPTGMYVADVATGRISKAITPQVTLWGISFSPDHSKIAYTTFRWADPPDLRKPPGPPFTLNITDLNNGATTVLLSSESDQYWKPIWSKDGNKIAFTVRDPSDGTSSGLFVIVLPSWSVTTVFDGETGVRIVPRYWLSDDIIGYLRKEYSTLGFVGEQIFTISMDGSNQHVIDEAYRLDVLGVIYPPDE